MSGSIGVKDGEICLSLQIVMADIVYNNHVHMVDECNFKAGVLQLG